MKLLVITVFLILVTLPVPAAAGTLSFDVSGVLGPVLQGPDPIQLAGATFTATGAIDPEALPIGISGAKHIRSTNNPVILFIYYKFNSFIFLYKVLSDIPSSFAANFLFPLCFFNAFRIRSDSLST